MLQHMKTAAPHITNPLRDFIADTQRQNGDATLMDGTAPAQVLPETIDATATGAGIAIFDFDETLVHQASGLIFLRCMSSWLRYRMAAWAAGRAARAVPKDQQINVYHAVLSERILADRTLEEVETAAYKAGKMLDWNEDMVAAFEEHQKAGRATVVATGSLALFVSRLLAHKGLVPELTIGTDMDVKDGRILVETQGRSCTGVEKRRRVAELLDQYPGPSWGYGNPPSDTPFLEIVDHPHEIIPER